MTRRRAAVERGWVLITALLMLVVVTIIALAMFHRFELDEKIAGNTREKHRALNAAESAQQYAEWWLAQGNGTTGIQCTSLVAASVGQVCANTLPSAVTSVATVPWKIGGANVGVTYAPPNMGFSAGGGVGTYYASPVFYISYLGIGTTPANVPGLVYQIDAVGYGGAPNSVAVVESTYVVPTSTAKDLGTYQ